ncbi:MAG: division plane positioning ATPase MipZ [Alphaproteobacteria bacterium]|nr:division plane positioning ATPase MipZ [Alphaproteobacteria bacterium]
MTGNEKGGTGKSTIAMHLIVGFLRKGHTVGSIDLDANQGTVTRYLLNRADFAKTRGLRLPMPEHHAIKLSTLGNLEDAQSDERNRLQETLEYLSARHDYVLMDSQGSDTYLSRLAHSHADTVITPLNDSFLDLDLLAEVRGEPPEVIGPSRYSEMVWAMKKIRAERDGGLIDWIVLRNRLTNLDARNKRAMADSLHQLAGRMGFRIVEGLGERVIYRELFLQGLTVLDLRDEGAKVPLRMSHLAARQEVRILIEAIEAGMKRDEPEEPEEREEAKEEEVGARLLAQEAGSERA